MSVKEVMPQAMAKFAGYLYKPYVKFLAKLKSIFTQNYCSNVILLQSLRSLQTSQSTHDAKFANIFH